MEDKYKSGIDTEKLVKDVQEAFRSNGVDISYSDVCLISMSALPLATKVHLDGVDEVKGKEEEREKTGDSEEKTGDSEKDNWSKWNCSEFWMLFLILIAFGFGPFGSPYKDRKYKKTDEDKKTGMVNPYYTPGSQR